MPQTLDIKTLDYWNMSSAAHGKPSRIAPPTTEQVLKVGRNNLAELNPARPLAVCFGKMLDEVIVGGRRSTKGRTAATVLRMAR